MPTIDFESLSISADGEGPEAFIQAYTSYLKFISGLPHVSTSEITYPPESGWSDFTETEKQLRRIGKTKAVVHLLRHIPQMDMGTLIAGSSTRQVEWRDSSKDLKKLAAATDFEDFLFYQSMVSAPECTLGPDEITVTFGGEDETSLIVNCVTGQVHDYYLFLGVPDNMDDVKPEGPEAWRELAPAQDAVVHFQAWKQKWIDQVWISNPSYHGQVQLEDFEDEDEFEAAKQVYQECGWPRKFRREECIEKLKALEF